MARPIDYVAPAYDPAAELNDRLQNAPVEHAEALLSLYKVLQGLHDHGVLALLSGTLGSSDKIIETLVEAARSEESMRMIRNVLVLAKSLANVDPVRLDGFAQALPRALDRVRAHDEEPPGFWGLLMHFRNRDLRRGVLFVNTLLEEFGKHLPYRQRP